MATFWAGVQYDRLGTDLQTLRQLHTNDPNLFRSQESTLAVCYAIDLLAMGDLTHAGNMAQSVIDGHAGNVHPDYLATAHLIFARIAWSRISKGGSLNIPETCNRYKTIIDLPEEGAFQVRAIARRELARLNGADGNAD